jgi:NAD(P)-dependent dehydrogenase (short-subunit alcohol dehydrogenase family)
MSHVIDTFLDRTIALGYGDVGLQVRRHLAGWPPDPPRMDGRTVLVTGAATGIGLAACRGFARLGASVRAVARSDRRAGEAVAQILDAVPGADARPLACDVSSIDAVRSFAARLSDSEPRLDVLVNNAGVMPGHRSRSVDGHELMFATHVLGPFGLVAGLRDLLARSAPARVITVSSGGAYGQSLPVGDPESETASYSAKRLYARTKRQQIVLTELWAQRLAKHGIVVHAMHPGWVDTPGVQRWLPLFRTLSAPIIRSPEDGADTIVWLGGAPEALECTGRFWQDRRPRPTHYRLGAGQDADEARAELWDDCAAQIGST